MIPKNPVKVSVITPTHQNREPYLKNLYRCFQSQTYLDCELLILDDSPSASTFFQNLNDPKVRYLHSQQPLTVGEKRNQLIQMATGAVIVHFDDDDYYAPHYIEQSVKSLGDRDFFTLSGWYTYVQNQARFFYWDTSKVANYHFKVGTGEQLDVVSTDGLSPVEKQDWITANQWGYGFSYIYKKHIFSSLQFAPVNFGEDYQLFEQILHQPYQVACQLDTTGLVLHIIHRQNTSIIYPQFLLPDFLLTNIFGEAITNYSHMG